jgi:arylformamidase
MTDWIDISVPIRTGMPHWPDNPPIVVERIMDIDHGGGANVSKLSLGVHTGTHVDAPVHFTPGAIGIDQVPLDALVGVARVIEIHGDVVSVPELEKAQIERGERILLKTRNSPAAWARADFVENAVALTAESATWLAERGVMTLGIDYLSVGSYAADNGEPVHRALIDAGIIIIEGLDLTRVPPGPCDLVCLPLKITHADGAPARAIVRPHDALPNVRG